MFSGIMTGSVKITSSAYPAEYAVCTGLATPGIAMAQVADAGIHRQSRKSAATGSIPAGSASVTAVITIKVASGAASLSVFNRTR